MKINDLNQINTSNEEGKLLLAAIAKITTECQTDKTPYEVIEQLNELADKMFAKKSKQELTHNSLIKKLKFKNLLLLPKGEIKDIYILKKLLDWQNGYSYIEWSEFKEKYTKCSICGSYDDDICVCYAR